MTTWTKRTRIFNSPTVDSVVSEINSINETVDGYLTGESWNRRTPPNSNWRVGQALWVKNYYPWEAESYPWQRDSISTNWTNRT